jgi:hypothetical protein
VIERGGINYVRGIVIESVSLDSDPDDPGKVCNPEYPTLFTDVDMYRSWIKEACMACSLYIYACKKGKIN